MKFYKRGNNNFNKKKSIYIDRLKLLLNIKIIIILFIILSIPYFDLPGLYMDAVNPDYVGLHIISPSTIPAWIFNDNIIAAYFGEMWHYPLLNSLYGTNFTAYIYILFSTLIGNGVATIRIVHIIFGILELLAIYYALFKATNNKNFANIVTLFVAIDPSFIFAPRTQYYLQLFPLIFFLFGIYFLNKKDILKNKSIIIPSILFGLAASSYFIFAGYYLAVVISLIIFLGVNKNSIKKVFISILGFIIGYLPYLYAHLSLLIGNGLDGYINLLKGLDTYGISEGQSGIINRISDIVNENYSLPGGDYIINMITGQNVLFPAIKTIFFIITLISIILTSIHIIRSLMKKENKNKEIFTLLIINSCIIIHYIIGLIVGSSLGYQHYIMILPLYYIIICFNIRKILSDIKQVKRINIAKIIITISVIILVLINFINIISGYEKINKTGGVGYYSSTINDLGHYLNSNITESDLIICPQWGYSMGLSIITAGKSELWNNTSAEEIINRLNDSEKEYGKIYLIDDNVTADDSIMRIVDATQKKNIKEIPFMNNDTLQIRLLVIE